MMCLEKERFTRTGITKQYAGKVPKKEKNSVTCCDMRFGAKYFSKWFDTDEF